MSWFRRRAGLVRLGVMLGRSERLSQWPIVAQVVASFVVVVSMLTSVGVWNVVTERHARAAARQPAGASDIDDRSAQVVTRRVSTEAGDLILVVVAGGDSVEPPPGVAGLPSQGKMVLSPHARQSLAELGDVLHYRDVGTVGEAGLLAPDELVAYIGVAASEFPSGPEYPSTAVIGFGTVVDNDTFQPELVGFYRAFGALILLVGFGLVVRGAVRVSETLQHRRLQALAALGLTPTERRFVSGARAATWSILGAGAGVAAFYGAAATASRIPFTTWTYFNDDVGVSPFLSGVVVVLTPLAAAIIAALPSRNEQPKDRVESVGRRLALPVAVAAMWSVAWLPFGNVQRLAWWAAAFLVFLALAFGITELIRLTGRLLGNLDDPVKRLAGRRMADRPAAHARLFAPVGLLLLIGVSAVPIATATGDRFASVWLDALASNGRRIVEIGTPRQIEFDQPYVRAAYPTLVTLEDGEPAGAVVVVATCPDLAAVRVDNSTACPDGPLLASDATEESVFDHGDVTVRRKDTGEPVTIPAPGQTIPISADPNEQLEGRIVVAPDTLGSPVDRFEQAGYLVVTDPDPQSLSHLEAAVAAAAPAASVRSELDLQIGQTRVLVPVSIGVRIASSVLVLLLLLAAAVAVMSEGLHSGRLHAPLKALGVSETFATGAYLYSTAVPAIITIAAATTCTAITLNTLTTVWNAPTTPPSTIALSAVVAGLTMLTTGLAGLPFVRSPLQAEALNLD